MVRPALTEIFAVTGDSNGSRNARHCMMLPDLIDADELVNVISDDGYENFPSELDEARESSGEDRCSADHDGRYSRKVDALIMELIISEVKESDSVLNIAAMGTCTEHGVAVVDPMI